MGSINRGRPYPFLDLNPCLWIGKDSTLTLSGNKITRLIDYSGNGIPLLAGKGTGPEFIRSEDGGIEIIASPERYLAMNHTIINPLGFLLVIKGSTKDPIESICEIKSGSKTILIKTQEDQCVTQEIDESEINSILIKPSSGLYSYHYLGLFPQFYKNWK